MIETGIISVVKKVGAVTAGFLQAFGISSYICAVAYFMWNGEKWFGKADNFITPILVLTLLSVSALICGLLVFGYPYMLWLDKKPKRALETVIATALCLVGFFILVFTLALIY